MQEQHDHQQNIQQLLLINQQIKATQNAHFLEKQHQSEQYNQDINELKITESEQSKTLFEIELSADEQILNELRVWALSCNIPHTSLKKTI